MQDQVGTLSEVMAASSVIVHLPDAHQLVALIFVTKVVAMM
jgi:hypothetical protein